jgi:hypothetical protein
MGWLKRGAARRARQPAPSRPITRARAGQSGTTGCRRGKGEEEESHVADLWGLSVSEREERRRGRRKLGCAVERPDGLAGLGQQRLSWVGWLASTV